MQLAARERPEGWLIAPPDVPLDGLKRIDKYIEETFERVDFDDHPED